MRSRSHSPHLSVVIPVYNDQASLLKAIYSVKCQNIDELEIIIIDDGSDRAVEIPNQKNLILIRHEQNRGAGAARNSGMMRAKGKYIAFLDSDDEWGRLET